MEVKKKSQLQEKRVAKEVSGKTVIASGALWGSKGDVRNDSFLIECKITGKKYYTLSFTTWEKIYKEAIRDSGRIPVMCIDLEDGKSKLAILQSSFVDSEFLYYNEAYKSFRVHDIGSPYNILFNSAKGNIGRLSVIPWDDFIELSKEMT